ALRRRWPEQQDLVAAQRRARRVELGRRRRLAGTLPHGRQRRGGFEGQRVHGRSVRRQAHPEVDQEMMTPRAKKMTRRNLWTATASAAPLIPRAPAERVLERTAAAQGDLVDAPKFEVDPSFPKPLPNHWMLGETIGVDVDSQDHVWIVHRADQVAPAESGLSQTPPISECCSRAPSILAFD